MTGAQAETLRARSARNEDIPFLDALLKNEAAKPDRGFTYPTCEDEQELLDELRAYGLALEEGVAILEHADGPVGCFGFLYEPKDLGASGTTAFLIGPLLAGAERPHDLMNAILDLAEREATRRSLQALRSCIAPVSTGLIGILTQRRWTLWARSLEMKLECGNGSQRVAPEHAVKPLKSGDPRMVEAAKLLADAFGWGQDAARRLQGYLDDKYQVAYLMLDGELAGVVIWYGVAPFARIENIVVRSDRRRRGLGSLLLNAAVASLQSLGRETIYLALDPENTGARELYRRHGFVESEASAVYGLDLRSR